ncbi:4-hydroxy-3-methylbut-2-enyl diphosphate reductase [Lactiplantibacillus daoliensis]|uniref:4-hydroxy-3-methylbut-2-enyl diphosphate reductase n=2 Tax=Lactiplantibacillus daoliensis TaxID=2559916 RepID=A0ABW1UFQ1_9LACO
MLQRKKIDEMKLWLYVGKNVRLVLKDGQVVEGLALDWNDSEDVGEDEISIGFQYYGESQISTIEVV